MDYCVIRSSRQSDGPVQRIGNRMSKVHVELRNNLAQIGILTLLRSINWSHHHVSRRSNMLSGRRSCQKEHIEKLGGFRRRSHNL